MRKMVDKKHCSKNTEDFTEVDKTHESMTEVVKYINSEIKESSKAGKCEENFMNYEHCNFK